MDAAAGNKEIVSQLSQLGSQIDYNTARTIVS